MRRLLQELTRNWTILTTSAHKPMIIDLALSVIFRYQFKWQKST